MSPRTTKQFENIRANKKHLIMEAALDVFAQKSYHGASMNDIAKKAGVSKGLIYNYFESKEALITELVVGSLQHIFDSFEFDLNNITDKEFGEYIIKYFDLLKKNAAFYRTFFGVFMQTEVMEIITPKLMSLLGPYSVGFTKYFESKGFKKPEEESLFFFTMTDGLGIGYLTAGLSKDYCIQRINDIYELN